MTQARSEPKVGSWTETIGNFNFYNLAFASAVVIIAYVQLADGRSTPEWLPINGLLSVLMFFVAIDILHGYGQTELVLAPMWDDLLENAPLRVRRRDHLIEAPLLFAVTVLPFSTLSPVSFGACMTLLGSVESGYSHMAIRQLDRRAGSIVATYPPDLELNRAFSGRRIRYRRTSSSA